jgi:hypothetical protein
MPLLAVLLLALTGCTTTRQETGSEFKVPSGSYQLIVMRPDIAVDVLTAGGQLERREDWTNTARDNLLASLQAQQSKRGGTTQIALTRADAGADDQTVLELNRLHEVVGQSVILHKYSPYQALPSKKGEFDWTLGELATRYGASSGYDYALFLYARDSFSSGGRAALQAVGFLGCIVGVCVLPEGGSQQAFASLVDLRSGKVVWFNFLQSSVGDIRTPEGADKMVSRLLDSMSDGNLRADKKR